MCKTPLPRLLGDSVRKRKKTSDSGRRLLELERVAEVRRSPGGWIGDRGFLWQGKKGSPPGYNLNRFGLTVARHERVKTGRHTAQAPGGRGGLASIPRWGILGAGTRPIAGGYWGSCARKPQGGVWGLVRQGNP